MKRRKAAIAIRRAKLSDAPSVAALMCELGYPTNTSQMRSRLRRILPNERYRTLVAEVNGIIAGMIGTLIYPSYEHDDLSGRIVALVVVAKARRRGIGSKLVAAAEKELTERGVTRIGLNTRLTRKEAHRFYEALGYRRNGFRFVKEIPRCNL